MQVLWYLYLEHCSHFRLLISAIGSSTLTISCLFATQILRKTLYHLAHLLFCSCSQSKKPAQDSTIMKCFLIESLIQNNIRYCVVAQIGQSVNVESLLLRVPTQWLPAKRFHLSKMISYNIDRFQISEPFFRSLPSWLSASQISLCNTGLSVKQENLL